MEKLLFSKIEAWVVALLLMLAMTGSILFGTLVADEAQSRLVSGKSPKYGALGDAAFALSSTPKTVRKLLNSGDPRLASRTARFGDRGGWRVIDGKAAPGGYLLLSRVDGDANMAIVELVDLSDFSVKKRWMPDPEALYEAASRESKITDFTHWTRERFRVAHPMLLPDGAILIRNHNSPMVRMDACQQVSWMQDGIDFHHSTNMDAEGNLWVPSRIEDSKVGMDPLFNDHALAKINQDGDVLYHKSMAEILIENDLRALVFGVGMYSSDPLHINDIQPALKDGPYWEKGDVFVSMRHRSLILQFRPATGKVVWLKQGPWMGQHDVDFINDTTIGVFNNNVYDAGAGWFVEGTSGVLYYDFETDAVTSPFAEAEEETGLLTLTEGLFDVAADGHVMIEEENSGRILFLGPQGDQVAEFINRADNGGIYRLGWSRLMTKAAGDAALRSIDAADCTRQLAAAQ